MTTTDELLRVAQAEEAMLDAARALVAVEARNGTAIEKRKAERDLLMKARLYTMALEMA